MNRALLVVDMQNGFCQSIAAGFDLTEAPAVPAVPVTA